jgi:folate-binding protein YgfZ
MEDPRPSELRRDPLDTGESVYTRLAGRLVPAHHGGYAALREGAALVDLSHKTILRLSGEKAGQMLDAVLTNEVPKGDRRGVYALLLNPKGRIQTDLRVLKADGSVLIDIEPEGVAAAKELLNRFAPFYRVEVEDLSETEAPWGILGLYGPHAGDLLDRPVLTEHETTGITLGDAAVLATGVAVPVPGYDLLGPADALGAASEHLTGRGALPVDIPAYETSRIEAGVPRFGSDMTPENFPAEAGVLDRAVSFEKGCYPGQETVARMRYRGHPNRTLRRLAVEGAPTPPGAEILQHGKRVGQITSVAPLPVGGATLALGYLSWNAEATPLHAGEATLRPLT